MNAASTTIWRNDLPLNQRTQHLLKALVERYIRDGQPVGSLTLARDAGLDLSAATVRNVMADLEELGYLRSPHTSAGRVPTVRGYRLFIDALLHVQPLAEPEIESLRRRIFQNLAQIHEQHALRHFPRKSHLMRDYHHSHAFAD